MGSRDIGLGQLASLQWVVSGQTLIVSARAYLSRAKRDIFPANKTRPLVVRLAELRRGSGESLLLRPSSLIYRASQIRTTPLVSAVTNRESSGLNATLVTCPSWPRKVWTSSPVATDHNFTVPSE